ncbi:MAG: hypothetical protein R2752_06980 [Vicinamibacterales bacterium]
MDSRPFRLALILPGLLLAPGVVSSFTPPAVPRASVQPTGLAVVFERGSVLQDRNGDDQIDFVAGQVVLPEDPAPQDVAAAAAVGARLGLETSGLTLPLVVRASEIPAAPAGGTAGTTVTRIVVGAANPLLPPAIAARAAALEPGQGLAAFAGGLVAIAGRDAAGTQAAGEAFASRSPYLWNVIGREEGDTFDRIAADAAGVLQDGGIAVTALSFDELVYEAEVPEMVRATVTATVPAGRATRARDRLTAIADGHRRGRETDRLNYASVREVVYRVADGRDTFDVSMPRVGLTSRYLNPPRREPTRFEGQRDTGAGRGRGAGAPAGGGGRGTATGGAARAAAPSTSRSSSAPRTACSPTTTATAWRTTRHP